MKQFAILAVFTLALSLAGCLTPQNISPTPTAQIAAESNSDTPPALPEESGELDYYLACGCGCCGGVEPQKQCLYESQGESLEKIKAQDLEASQSETCMVAGCSLGTNYTYCD